MAKITEWSFAPNFCTPCETKRWGLFNYFLQKAVFANRWVIYRRWPKIASSFILQLPFSVG
jgi:hypothetical protein